MLYINFGDYMKEKLIKGMSSIFFAVILGCLCGYLLYATYSKETKYLASNNVVYLIEYKEYSSYDSMKLANINNDYTYYKDNNTYYTVIGFSKSRDNIDKINKIFNDINIIKCYIDDPVFLEKLDDFDKELSNISDENGIKEVLDRIIKFYNDNKVEILKVYE